MFLFSLDPHIPKDGETNNNVIFHGILILGKVEIVDIQDRKKLLSLLASDIRKSDGWVAACFNPRHGLRVVNGSEVVDFSICFECLQARPYNFNREQGILIEGNADTEFNAFLDRFGIPKADPDR